MGYIADLSKWQGDIDFGKLKGKVDFVILKVQAGYTSIDPKYKEYVKGCKDNGIPFGTYAYFRGVSVPDSIAEAKNALELTDPDSKFFVVDIEDNCNNDLVGTGQAFVDYLKNKGVKKVGLYSGEYFYTKHNLNAIKCDFTWIANYGANDGQQHTAPKVACDLWQYTSVGKLDGIPSLVDLNVLTGSKPLAYFTGEKWNPFIAQVRVTASALNVRQGPGNEYPVLQVAPKGKVFNVTANIDDWHEVILDDKGTTGYCFGKNGTYLELIR